ncbi:MAG: kinase [Pseudomonadota bacterium]
MSVNVTELVAELNLQLPAAVAVADTASRAWLDVARLLTAWQRQAGCSIIGINGSQGSGKSTLAAVLSAQLNHAGVATTHVSIDDFYLSKAARVELAETVHPLLRTRGVPGTHDHARLRKVVEQIIAGAGQTVVALALPQFDKGLDDVAGERHVQAQVLILEGWCVGAQAQADTALEQPLNRLEAESDQGGVWRRWVNQQLRAHYQPLWESVDLWVNLRVPSFEQVYAWRGQQEQSLPAEQRMTELELRRFIDHYERLTRATWAQPLRGPGLTVQLAPDHSISAVSRVV